MRNLVCISLLALLFSCDQRDCCVPPHRSNKPLHKAVDISFLPEIEAAGIKFYNASGTQKDMLDIFKENGVNTVRLRLWHTPENDHASLAEVKTFSERIKAKGLKVWLTVHYSDTWADPGHQTKPAAWADATNNSDLADSVYNYTKKVMNVIDPEIIQIGNEINGGFLWPNGNTSENLPTFISFLKKGVQAVRETSPETQIMIHVAGFDVATWFYQQLKTNEVDYDLIGLSYYPIWHGKNLTTVSTNINSLEIAHQKPVIIAETAYPFSLGYDDWTNNIVGEQDQLVSGYPATPAGQKKFLLKIRDIVSKAPLGGEGFCYWGAEWVSFKGNEAENGSTWENQALFDFNNKAVPALEVFKD